MVLIANCIIFSSAIVFSYRSYLLFSCLYGSHFAQAPQVSLGLAELGGFASFFDIVVLTSQSQSQEPLEAPRTQVPCLVIRTYSDHSGPAAAWSARTRALAL